MPHQAPSPSRWTWFSPWVIIGSVCILAGILLILAIKNIDREKEFTERALLSQAKVLMRSIEAGNRAGMMGPGWGRRHMQLLMEETARQPEVLYLAVVTSRGEVLSHSDQTRVGQFIPVSLPQARMTMHGFRQEGRKSFEVLREYQPWIPRQRGRNQRDLCEVFNRPGEKLYILLGLDPTPFEEAQEQDMRQTALLFGIMLLIGAAGFMSLVWAQHYRSARSSLKDVQAFTSTLINQMPIGFVATDRKGRIQNANEAALAILKQPATITESIGEFPCFTPIFERLKREESVVGQEIGCRANEMTESIPLLVNAAPIRGGEEPTGGFIFLFSDISRIKQLEEQLRRSERLAGLGRLAAGLAHEIRNPLSSIKGFATILAARFGQEDRSRKIAEVMVQEVDRLNRVVTELLDYARPPELKKRSIPCGEILQTTLRLIEQDARGREVKVEVRVSPEDLEIEVDPDRFPQALLNLCLNGLQAMEDGGTLRIEAFRKNGRAILEVTDTGVGIAPEHLPHIFDPYFTTKASGVGLGLANVHKYIEAHGGKIEVDSIPGQGTRFIITF